MKIQGTSISMTRGDSESITVRITQGEGLTAGDRIDFTVRQSAEEPIELQKTVTEFPDGDAVIVLRPEDTTPMEFGSYVYDIQLTRADGTVQTIIKPSKFKLEQEVTYNGG